MASGCILGDCPYCKELVWEDSWSLDKFDRTCHPECKSKENTIKANFEFLKAQLDIAVEALEKMDDRKHGMIPRSEMARFAKAALDQIYVKNLEGHKVRTRE